MDLDYHHEDLSDSQPFLNDNTSAQQEPKTRKHLDKFRSFPFKSILYTLCAHLVPGALVTILVLFVFSKSPIGSGDEINGIVPASK